jgi:hypothetical protein
MKKSELNQLIKEELINQFTKNAAIDRLEQVMYTFKSNTEIVNKIKELLTLIKAYN